MRKISALLLSILFLSCMNSKEEQMLEVYQQKNVKTLNFDLNDLDFEINKIEKVSDITASDSIKNIKKELAELWTSKPEQSLIDTISFPYVKKVLDETITRNDTLYKLYQEAVLTAIKTRSYSSEYEYKRKRDKALDDMVEYKKTLAEVKSLEGYYNKLSEKPDSILSTKYITNYSIKNPILGNTKQTFDKFYYTNPEQTEFVKEEMVEN